MYSLINSPFDVKSSLYLGPTDTSFIGATARVTSGLHRNDCTTDAHFPHQSHISKDAGIFGFNHKVFDLPRVIRHFCRKLGHANQVSRSEFTNVGFHVITITPTEQTPYLQPDTVVVINLHQYFLELFHLVNEIGYACKRLNV